MAIYKVVIGKVFNGAPFAGEKWTNVYNCNTATPQDAVDFGIAVATLEMGVSYEPIEVTDIVAYDPGNPADRAQASPGNNAALDPTGLGGYLPLFNTVRVVLGDALKRKEQKYLRLGATPANIGAGEWDGAFVTEVDTGYAQNLIALPELCGPSGEPITTATVLAKIQIRQLDWHRRTRVGFHRGWVAN